jgi:hypothetical protein
MDVLVMNSIQDICEKTHKRNHITIKWRRQGITHALFCIIHKVRDHGAMAFIINVRLVHERCSKTQLYADLEKYSYK